MITEDVSDDGMAVVGWAHGVDRGCRDDHGEGDSPEDALRAIESRLTVSGEWLSAGREDGPLGRARVCRVRPGRALHVIGASPMADRIRELLAQALVSGWALHPVPPGRTPLHVLEDPLLAASGSRRIYNLLDRNGFATVEELAAARDDSLLSIRQGGQKMVATVRQILREMGWSSDGLALPSVTDVVVERLTRTTGRLAEGQRLRYREFAGMLARSSMPLAALDRIVDSLNAEIIPLADPLVCLLLETAGEEDLADRYRRTHARAVDAGDSIVVGAPEPST